ncbi:hypothetical protein JCM10449v2_006695 [Rhodotorula kratochvilovae]
MDHEILISSSSSTATDKPPPLLWLPNELLDEIFRLAYQDEPVHKPICRRLYPIQQKYLYRRVRLDSYEALGSFCFAVRTVPVVRKHVVELDLRMTGEKNCVSKDGLEHTPSIGDDESDDEDGVSQVVTTLQLSVLLARLPSLRVLDLQELDDALMKVVFRGKTTPQNLALLEVLKISTRNLSEVDEHDDEGAWLRQLAQLSHLKEFHLRQREFGIVLPSVKLPTPTLPSLTTLVIVGSACEEWVQPTLRDLVPNLLHLKLEELEENPQFAEILRSTPVSLRSLILSSAVSLTFQAPALAVLDNVLPRFTRIEHLALCEGAFTPNGIVPCLRSLPSLRSLSFGLGTLATDELLLSLVDGPFHLPHLRRLTLDHVECARGPTMKSKGWKFPPEQDALLFHLWQGWVEPVWGPACSEEGIKVAVVAARANGITVDGVAVNAIGFDNAYYSEVTTALLLWGDKTGNDSEARDLMGDDIVDEHIEW